MTTFNNVKTWLAKNRNSWSIWCILGIITALATGITLALTHWEWLRSGTGGSVESNSTTLRNYGFLIAGIIALILAVWRSSISERQAGISQIQANIAQESQRFDSYQRAAEMLGSTTLTTRLGGIYALHQLANNHPQEYHLQVIELFCAYVKNPPTQGKTASELQEDFPSLRKDVQAVMTAIGNRTATGRQLERALYLHLDLRGADLTNVDLDSANLEYTDLSRAILENANLYGTSFKHSYLRDAIFSRATSEDATFQNAGMTRAQMDHMDILTTDFSGAALYEVDFLDTEFYDVNFTRASLRDANLSGARFYAEEEVNQDSNTRETISVLITQAQLDTAWADPARPPTIDNGTSDIESHQPLTWKGGAAVHPYHTDE